MTRRRPSDQSERIPSTQPLRCPIHGVPLEQGPGPAGSAAWCPVEERYSTLAACPFVCPLCRHPLDWAGECNACHGSTTGERDSWTFPGDRYDRFDDQGEPLGDGLHWYLTKAGPRRAVSAATNVANMQLLRELIAKIGIAKDGEA